ncbi:class E sortase [Streptomyces sp. LP05-1]|uniref:Class E sortase n=1 Tax=Streptomyces pyxinae TaxID=2970734 RepID=A0ABT2CCU0_9ACTN|nr:class E sortase [Streptomyces sp. LP05-1]MCS0635231.1 class E sortase [Streptomyces sp. LP05-1]
MGGGEAPGGSRGRHGAPPPGAYGRGPAPGPYGGSPGAPGGPAGAWPTGAGGGYEDPGAAGWYAPPGSAPGGPGPGAAQPLPPEQVPHAVRPLPRDQVPVPRGPRHGRPPGPEPYRDRGGPGGSGGSGAEAPYPGPVRQDETMALRAARPGHSGADAGVPPAPGRTAAAGGPAVPPAGGRAERRRAARARGRRHGAAPAAPAPVESGRPLTRVEARRAARARKDSAGVIASRVAGELFITLGLVMLLFVTYQLWWTNVRAGQQADRARSRIEDSWAAGRRPDAFEPGQGFAIMYIPKLDVVVPVAEGTDKEQVLDRGMVGHYGSGGLRTALPSAKQGNFAVAGHRNTHGEPFRYINRLVPGDPIVVETQDAYYTYEMTRTLPQTPPSNVSVIQPVPPGSGFDGPGRYITLTTCTPEFTSTYRMIVWGKMVEERPRSKGKPDALVG